jgi:murein hydrolase activator
MTALFSAIRSFFRRKTAACHPIVLAAAMVLAWGAADDCRGAPPAAAIVQVSNLNLRSKPELASKSLAVLNKGARVEVVRLLDGWVQVTFHDHVGYLRNRKRYLRLVPAASGKARSKKTAASIEKIKKKAVSLQHRIERSEAEVVSYSRQEAKMVDTLDDLDRALSRTRALVAAARREAAELETRISSAQSAILDLGNRIRIQEAYAARRLVAMYKLNWLGRINILASAESMSGLFHRERAMERIIDHDERVLKQLANNRLRFRELEASQTERKKAKLTLENELAAKIRQMSEDRERRGRLLDDIQGKKSMALAAIDSLKRAASALDQKIEALGLRPKEREPKKPAPLPQKPKASPTAATPAAPAAKPPPASKPPEARSGRPAAGPFHALKGLLNMPVDGKVISFFGPYKNAEFNVMNFCSGLDIRADRGEPVRAVQGGNVLYATWFKGYGNMLIIDHGESYYSVYAHVEEMFKEKGAQVEAGEVIATVGDTGSMLGPKLHFEIRHHGKPLDPMKWIKKG